MQAIKIKSLDLPEYEDFQFDRRYGISSRCYVQLLNAVNPYFNAVVLDESKTFEGSKEGFEKAVNWLEEKRKNILADLVGKVSNDPDLKSLFSNQDDLESRYLEARYIVYSDTLCSTCKWDFGVSDDNPCKDHLCEQCQNSTGGTCNCLQIPAEGEERCPYYIPCKKEMEKQ